jgi:TonB-linked SusC/RagA family outer membrane protein
VVFSTIAQERKVTGKVTASEDGSSLPGVSIQLKGTNKGVQADGNGNYSIPVTDNGSILVFSYIGFLTQEVVVGNKSVVNLELVNDSKQLSEVVITAIGVTRDKKALGYASSTVNAEQMAQKSEPDPLRSLTGKVPGVNIIAGGGSPGQGTRITIRGNNSFTGNNQPLFVVDGIPFDNSVNSTSGFNSASTTSNRAYDMDPNNIESLTILKGAAASALYGSRAANGVVVITTKAGSKSAKKGLEVTYNSSYSVENISSIPDYQDTYTQGSNQNYSGGFIGNWGTVFPSEVDRINAGLGFNRYSKTIEPGYPEGTVSHPLVGVAYGAARYKNIFPELLDKDGKAIPVPLQPYDIIGGFFRTGKVMENGLNISSTGDKTSLNATISHLNNDGMVPNSNSTRTALSFGGNASLSNGLTVSGNVSYTNTTQENPQSGASFFNDYSSGGTGSIYSRLFYLPRNYNLNGYPFENPVTGGNVFYRALDNPLWTAKYNTYTSDVNRVRGLVNLIYDVTPWLNLVARGGIDTYNENRRNIIAKGGSALPLGIVSRDDIQNTEIDYTFIATVSKDISEKIGFKFTAGLNANERSKNIFSTSGNNITVFGLNKLDATGASIVNNDFNSLRRLWGIFGEAQLTYNNYLFLTASIRNDHSSTLPKANNSYVYPAVSASFVFTDAFNLSSSFLNFGKIRANWASVGKDADPYSVNTAYNIATPYTNNAGTLFTSASISGSLNNANLKPEITTEYEVGTELQLFNKKVGIDFAYFNRTSKNLIVPTRYPGSTGFNFGIVNAGEINNNGIELGLNLIPISTASGFKWESTLAYQRLRSKVVDAGPQKEIFLGGTGLSSLGTMHRTGEPFGMIFGSVNARDDDGNLLINQTTGATIFAPKSQLIGNPAPNYSLGWTNTLSFKNFNLSALLDYRDGGSMYSVTAASLILRGQLKMSEDREGMRVIPGVVGDPQTFKAVQGADGKAIKNTATISAFDYHFSNGFGAYGAEETNIYDVTVIRLREVTFGYSVPKSFLRKSLKFLGALNVSLSGRNLWFFAPNMLTGLNFDPEVLSSFPDSNIQGFDLGAAPSSRRFGVNLTAKF